MYTYLHSGDFQIAFDEKGYNVVQCTQNICTGSFEKSTLKNDFYNFYFFLSTLFYNVQNNAIFFNLVLVLGESFNF